LSDMNSAMRGGVDLSALANKVVKEKLASTSSVQVDQGRRVKVPAFVVEVNQSNLKPIIELSSIVAVVVTFYSQANAESLTLNSKLEKLANAAEGKWLLAKIDLDANPEIASAFGVNLPATIAVILEGEPKPLFQGDQPESALVDFLGKLVEVAASQGLNGTLEVDGVEPKEVEPQLSESEIAALDAMDKGDFGAAVKIYEEELKQNPGNEELAARLAQVKLVERTYNADLEKELSVESTSVAMAMRKADFHLAVGQSEEAFELLLAWFDKADGEERKALSSLFLELFNVVGKSHPAVVESRKLLAAKMF
jgi:putative thioredoxin